MKERIEIGKYKRKLQIALYVILLAGCFLPFVGAPIALFAGLTLAMTVGAPYRKLDKFASKYLLQASVVGLGFGMNLTESVRSGSDGMLFTLLSVTGVLFAGIFVGKKIGVKRVPAYLIASGTAICGGSAIAAVGPIAKADDSEMSVSLAVIFVLNAVALFLFPVLGHLLNLTEQQFGIWAAISIHDTSSVVGAASVYGEEALKIAATVKLTRALWIIPLSVFTMFRFKSSGKKISVPWFIVLFILAMTANTYLEIPAETTQIVSSIAKKMLTITLFFIGAGLSRKTLKSTGLKPLLLGIILWALIGTVSLAIVVAM